MERSRPQSDKAAIGRLAGDEDGVVLIFTTILIPLLLTLLAFTVEMGQALSMRGEQQRAADLAAYAGAYRAAQGPMQAALAEAEKIAGLNSPDALERRAETTLFDGVEDDAVQVTVARSLDLRIARLAGLGETLDIEAQAVALTQTDGI